MTIMPAVEVLHGSSASNALWSCWKYKITDRAMIDGHLTAEGEASIHGASVY